jgi:two-component system nitrate/nitrite response regulator NarL
MTHKMVATYVGGGATSDSAPAARPSNFSALSSRELEILRGIARGSSNKEIGRELGIAETTVKVHVQNVLRKLQVTTRVHAAVLATEIGLF